MICKLCRKKENVIRNISLSEIENWGGFGREKIKKTKTIVPYSDFSNLSINKECAVCAAGNKASGAHRCIVCTKAIHIIDENCSVVVEGSEEGYGEKRICIDCFNKKGNSIKE